MAEGGEKGEEDNPFSFKKFVSKKDKKKEDAGKSGEDDDFDIFDMSDNASQRKREKPRQVLLVEEGTVLGSLVFVIGYFFQIKFLLVYWFLLVQ